MIYNEKVLAYIIAEVRRQGHKFWDEQAVIMPLLDGPRRTLWMLHAWEVAQNISKIRLPLSADIETIGTFVDDNAGFRKCGVRVGDSVCPDWKEVPDLINKLLLIMPKILPEEFYREFLEIHPFIDGNGRTGKILYNWLKGTLNDPIMPPNFFNCLNP